MMPNVEELNEMRQADVRTADRDRLADLCEVEIDKTAKVEKRIAQYLEEVKNPFLVKIGDYTVKFTYPDSGDGLEDRLLAYVSEMAKIRC